MLRCLIRCIVSTNDLPSFYVHISVPFGCALFVNDSYSMRSYGINFALITTGRR